MKDEPDTVDLPSGPLKCGTKSCDRLSVMIVFWPGQATRMCGFCVVRAHGIAKAMGFELSATLDDGRQLGPAPDSNGGPQGDHVLSERFLASRGCLATCAPDANYHDPQCSKRDPRTRTAGTVPTRRPGVPRSTAAVRRRPPDAP
jgi:hypothetical protein